MMGTLTEFSSDALRYFEADWKIAMVDAKHEDERKSHEHRPSE